MNRTKRFRDLSAEAKASIHCDVMSDARTQRRRRRLPIPDQQWNLVTLPVLGEKPEESPVMTKPVQSTTSQANSPLSALVRRAGGTDEGHCRRSQEPRQARAGAARTYSPHMNVWPDVRQWVDPFKANAHDHERGRKTGGGNCRKTHRKSTASSSTGCGWQVRITARRCSIYIMPFKGQSEDNLRRMHGLAFSARGENHQPLRHAKSGDDHLGLRGPVGKPAHLPGASTI